MGTFSKVDRIDPERSNVWRWLKLSTANGNYPVTASTIAADMKVEVRSIMGEITVLMRLGAITYAGRVGSLGQSRNLYAVSRNAVKKLLMDKKVVRKGGVLTKAEAVAIVSDVEDAILRLQSIAKDLSLRVNPSKPSEPRAIDVDETSGNGKGLSVIVENADDGYTSVRLVDDHLDVVKFSLSPDNTALLAKELLDSVDPIHRPIGAPLSARTMIYLSDDGITTIGQLVDKTKVDLLRIPNIGRKAIEEIVAYLATFNLRLLGDK